MSVAPPTTSPPTSVAATTAAAGTCGTCSAPLTPGQRYCLACGARRGELPFQVPERSEPLLTPAARKSFGVVGVIVLASGVLIGATIGPAITPDSIASTAGQLIIDTSGAGGSGGTGGATNAASSKVPPPSSSALATPLGAPTGQVAKPPPVVINRGGGGGAPQRSQPAPAAPAPAAPPAAAKPLPPPANPPAPLPPAGPESDPVIAGTVVHLSHAGHGYAIATPEGQLIALHAKKPPTALGDKLKVTVHALDNGTFDDKGTKVVGHQVKATIGGTVTFADPLAGTYTVSTRGASILVHLAPPPNPLAPPLLPPRVGTPTTVDVAFVPSTDPKLPPQLQETKRVDAKSLIDELDLEAIVLDPGPNPEPGKLLVSADDAGESPSTLALTVPPKLDVSKLKPKTVISALVKREKDGSFTLVSAAPDP